MTAWASDALRKVYTEGTPIRVAVYVTEDISDNDTVDVGADFTVALAASLVVVRSAAAVSCPVLGSVTVAVPALGSLNIPHDAGWLTVTGTAK